MWITWKTKINLHLNQSYINVWNRNLTPSRFRIPLLTIPIQFQTILTEIPPLTLPKTIPIPTITGESESFFDSDSRVWIAPGLNHFPVIIMLVCKLKRFKKVINITLLFTFTSKTLIDSQGTKNCSVIEMYSWLYLSTFWKYSECTWVHFPKKECTCT